VVEIAATADVAQPPERLWPFLSDLRNHWRLTPSFAEVESVDGDRSGARVRISGRFGVSRTARTRILEANEPRELLGRADVGRGTVGSVRWLIEPSGDGSRVTLSAEVVRASLHDRLLLVLGGRRLLRRGFEDALEQLGRMR
jgi:carbon monoxide dehydrogenase subunit G